MGKDDLLELATVNDCGRCLGGNALHPCATLARLDGNAPQAPCVRFGCYAVLFIEEEGQPCCGCRSDDFACAAMSFRAPGGDFRQGRAPALGGKGWLLAFHPALLPAAPPAFFGYRPEEALHLSRREAASVEGCLARIGDELRRPADTHTAALLSAHIVLLLRYCGRYYERQFITRENCNKALMRRFARLLDERIAQGALAKGAALRPGTFADALGLSPAYFADLLRFETGKSFAEYLRLRQFGVARRLLAGGVATPAAVARLLGFPSTESFAGLFRKLTGVDPADYRYARN